MEQKTLISALGQDLQERIAKTIFELPDSIFADLLTFSEVCQDRKQVVGQTLGYQLTFSDHFDDIDDATMLSYLGSSAQAIELSARLNRSIPMGIDKLSLRKASITSRQAHLHFITRAINLTELHIVIEHPLEWLVAMTALANLQFLTRLCIVFRFFDTGKTLSDCQLFALPEFCPNIMNLEIHNSCKAIDRMGLWAMIKRMHKLEIVRIWKGITDNEIKFLRGLKEVHINKAVSFQHAISIGTPLVVFYNKDHVASAEDIELLGACPNLKDVSLCLRLGCENFLPGKFRHLEKLHLCWDPYRIGADREVPNYELNGSAILQIVKDSPKLKAISLSHVITPVDIVIELIKLIGDNLELITVTVDSKGACFGTKVLLILEAAVRHCRKVNAIYVFLAVRASCASQQRAFNIFASPELQGRFDYAAAVLEKRSPKFSEESIWHAGQECFIHDGHAVSEIVSNYQELVENLEEDVGETIEENREANVEENVEEIMEENVEASIEENIGEELDEMDIEAVNVLLSMR